MSKFKAVRKALVAVAGVAVAFGLLDEGVAQDMVGVLTVVLVYLVPNEQAARSLMARRKR